MVPTFTGLFFRIKGNDALKKLEEYLQPSRNLGNVIYFYYLLNRLESSPHGRAPFRAYRLLTYKMGTTKVNGKGCCEEQKR